MRAFASHAHFAAVDSALRYIQFLRIASCLGFQMHERGQDAYKTNRERSVAATHSNVWLPGRRICSDNTKHSDRLAALLPLSGNPVRPPGNCEARNPYIPGRARLQSPIRREPEIS